MKTSSIGSAILTLWLCLLLALPHAVSAQEPSIFDIVRQTSQGIVPNAANYGQYIPPNATGYAAGPQAESWLRGVTGASSGWSYTAANGWQLAVTDQIVQPSGGYVAERVAYAAAPPKSDFVPGWSAFVGSAFWNTIYGTSPLFGLVLYGPTFVETWQRWQPQTSGVVN